MTRVICLQIDCIYNDKEVCAREVITIEESLERRGKPCCADYEETTPRKEE